MSVLSKARKQDVEPLPTPWFNGLLRRGILAEIGAAPNVGKSFVALRWALHLAERGYPVLYCGWDTPALDQGERMFNMWHQREASSEDEMQAWLNDPAIPFRWCFQTVDTAALSGVVAAETIYFGEPPALVVVDVLGDLVTGDEGVEAVSGVVRDLKSISREHDTCVLALHHLRDGVSADGNSPVGLPEFRYEKGRFAEVMFGLWRPASGALAMRVLKNRSGARGDTANLTFDPARGYVEFSH